MRKIKPGTTLILVTTPLIEQMLAAGGLRTIADHRLEPPGPPEIAEIEWPATRKKSWRQQQRELPKFLR